MLLEHLESRRLLSVSLNSSTGLLTVLGSDSRNDVITMSVTNGVLKVVDNGRTHSFSASRVKRINADGKLGADTIRLSESVKAPATLYTGADRTYDGRDETLVGGGGNDRLIASGGRRAELLGGGGNDYLEGRGEVHLDGGAGNDRIVQANGGSFSVNGGSGTDTFDASRAGGHVFGNDPDVEAAGLARENRSFLGIDNWIGNANDNTIVGSNSRNIIRGGGGNDRILARGGDDELYGGTGNDTLDGGTGIDALHGEDGNDTLYARDGTRDFLSGGYGTDKAKKDSIDQVVGVESFLS